MFHVKVLREQEVNNLQTRVMLDGPSRQLFFDGIRAVDRSQNPDIEIIAEVDEVEEDPEGLRSVVLDHIVQDASVFEIVLKTAAFQEPADFIWVITLRYDPSKLLNTLRGKLA